MKMFLEILLLMILVVILVWLLWPAPIVQQNFASSVCFGKNCFQVGLAKTQAERDQGLMYRKSLDKDRGMLFIFDKEGIYSFWMKNTLIPLDIIWIDSAGKVVFASQNVQPCKNIFCSSIIPSAKARYVLEINAGICQEIGLRVGDKLKITL